MSYKRKFFFSEYILLSTLLSYCLLTSVMSLYLRKTIDPSRINTCTEQSDTEEIQEWCVTSVSILCVILIFTLIFIFCLYSLSIPNSNHTKS